MVPQEYREEKASSQVSRNSMVAVKETLLPLYDDCNIQAVGAVVEFEEESVAHCLSSVIDGLKISC